MRIDRIFSQRALNPAGPAFDRGGPDGTTGALQGARAEGAALDRSFARENAAVTRQTAALVAKGQADANLGRVIAGAGRDLTEIAIQAKIRRNRELAETEFQNAKVELDRIRTGAEAYAGQGAPDGSDYPSRYAEKFAEGRDLLFGKISNQDARRLAAAHAGNVERAGAQAVRTNQAARETSWSQQQLDIRTGDRQKRIAALRGPAQAAKIAEANADFTEQQRLGTISNGESRIAALRHWAQGTIARDAQADPADARAVMNAGGYDHLLANGLERAAAAAAISGALKTRRAVEGREVAGLIAEDLARRESSGQGVAGLRQRIVNLGDEAALQNYDAKAAQALSYFATMTEIRFAPAEQAWNLVRARRPEPGAESFAVKQKLYLAAVKALQDRQRQFAHDPAGFAAVLAAGGPGPKMPAPSRAKNIALQQVIGGPDFPYRYFSNREAAQAAGDYDKAGDKADFMARLLAPSGAHRALAIRDFLAFSHSPAAPIVAGFAHDPEMAPALNRIIAAEAAGRRALEKGLSETQTEAVKGAIDEQLAGYFRTASSAGTEDAAIAEQTRDGIHLFALDLVAGGRSPAAAARLATDRLVNDHFEFSTTYRVPKSYDLGSIQAYTAAVLAAHQTRGAGAEPVAEDQARAPILESNGRAGQTVSDAAAGTAENSPSLEDGPPAGDPGAEAFLIKSAVALDDIIDLPDGMEITNAGYGILFMRAWQLGKRYLPRIFGKADRAKRMDRAKIRIKSLWQDKNAGTIEMTPEDFGADVSVGDAASLYAEMTVNGERTPHGQKQPVLNLGPLPQRAIDRIRDEQNIDLKGYRQIMTTAKVKHAYDRHGPSETDKVQIPITFADYGVAPAIIAAFSEVKVHPKSGSKPLRIQFIKKMPNGVLHVVEAVGGQQNQLSFWNMWKKKN
jgi:hypothetical protein